MSLNLDKSTWRRVTMGEVVAASKEKCDPQSGDVERYIAGDHMGTSDLKIRRWGNVEEVDLGPAFHRRFRPGQVLYGSRRAYLRKVAVAEFDGVCSNTTYVVETKDENLLSQKFLPFLMSSEKFHGFAVSESKGSVNPYVNWSDLERYEFELPPLDQQQRIADLLWAIESHSHKLEELRSKLMSARAIWIDRFLVGVPTEPLRETVSLLQGKPVSSQLYGKGDLPLIRAGDLKPNGVVSWSSNSVRIPSEVGTKYPDHVLNPGDVVINMTAQSLEDAFLGRVCEVTERSFLNQRIGKLESRVYSSELLRILLTRREFTEWVALRSEGSKVKHMHWRHIESYPMPVLDDAAQDALTRGDECFNRAIDSYTMELKELQKLKSALLHVFFGDN